MDKLAQYLKEREGFDSIVTDKGFVAYRVQGTECWIYDIYVHADFRKMGIASFLAKEVEAIAKAAGCTTLCGSVAPKARNSTDSLKFQLAYGMKLHSSAENVVHLRKEI